MVELTKLEAEQVLYAMCEALSLLEEDPAADPDGVIDCLKSAEDILRPCIENGSLLSEMKKIAASESL